MKTQLGTEVDLGPGHNGLDWDPAPSATPLFSAHVYCGHGRPSQLLLSSCYFGCVRFSFFSSMSKNISEMTYVVSSGT